MAILKWHCKECNQEFDNPTDANYCERQHGSDPIYESVCNIYDGLDDKIDQGTARIYPDGSIEVTAKTLIKGKKIKESVR